jgi:hypothetical protein
MSTKNPYSVFDFVKKKEVEKFFVKQRTFTLSYKETDMPVTVEEIQYLGYSLVHLYIANDKMFDLRDADERKIAIRTYFHKLFYQYMSLRYVEFNITINGRNNSTY